MSRIAMENPEDRRREQISVWCTKEWYNKIMEYSMKHCKSASSEVLEAIQDKINKDDSIHKDEDRYIPGNAIHDN